MNIKGSSSQKKLTVFLVTSADIKDQSITLKILPDLF